MGTVNNIVERLIVLNFLRKLATDFSRWPEVKKGFIETDGTVTKEGRGKIPPITNLVRRLKIILSRYTGLSHKIAAFLLGAALLREAFQGKQQKELLEDIGLDPNVFDGVIDPRRLEEQFLKEVERQYDLQFGTVEKEQQILAPGTYVVETLIEPEARFIRTFEIQQSNACGVFTLKDVFGKSAHFLLEDVRPTGDPEE